MKYETPKSLLKDLLHLLPKNHLSYWTGRIAQAPLHPAIAKRAVSSFAKMFKLNMGEAEFPIEEYPTVEALFTRRLKAGLRPIGEGVVHPVDGKLTTNGEIVDGILMQAKGKVYTVEDLLKSEDEAHLLHAGYAVTYYLSPQDYHRVHTPFGGEVVSSRWVPGHLWPVNSWSVEHVDRLFVENERLITTIKSPRGTYAVVMVGATNVGQMTVSYDGTLRTNRLKDSGSVIEKKYEHRPVLQTGEELGVFHLGSTVICLYPKGFFKNAPEELPEQMTKMGQTLGK